MIGTTVGHFRIIAKLADSGSGEVYRAEDEALRRPVALEVLALAFAADPDQKTRFMNAARAAAVVTHPNLAAIHELGESDGRVWVAMELVDGASLRSRLRGRPLPLLETLRIGEQVAEGMAAAHEAGLAHGDLSAEKVLLGAGGQVKVVELGLASAAPAPREDVYRLGAMLYEMATGQRPRASLPTGTAEEMATIPPSMLNPDIPAELDRIIGACLESDPDNRYQHAGDLAADLGRFRRRTETMPPAVPSGEARVKRNEAWTTRRIVGWSAAALVLATALGLAGWRWVWPVLKPAPPFKPGDRILVADFENDTDDAELGLALRDLFEMWIGDMVRLAVVPRVMTAGTGAVYGPAAEARCLKGECEGYVTGRLIGDPAGYTLRVALHRVGLKEPILDLSARADEASFAAAYFSMFFEIERISQERWGLGTVHQPFCTAYWSQGVNGLKAIRESYIGMRKRLTRRAEAQALFERAVELDPTCAPCLFYLAFNTMATRKERLRLFEEASRLGAAAAEGHPECREDALMYDVHYLERSWGYDAELERLSRGLQLFPLNTEFQFMYAITSARTLDDPAVAVPIFQKVMGPQPNPEWQWEQLAFWLLASGKVDEAQVLLTGLRQRSGESALDLAQRIGAAEVDLAFIRGDDSMAIAAMIDGFVAAGTMSEEAARGLKGQALASAGRFAEAVRLLRESARSGETAATRAGVASRRSYGTLDWLEKRRTGKVRVLRADEADRYLDHYLVLLELAAVSVDLDTAHPLAEILRAAEEEHRDIVNQRVLDAFQYARGCLALIEDRPAEAVRFLEPLGREYGLRSIVIQPNHALGRAYERAGRWVDAAQAYERVLEAGRLVSYVYPFEWAVRVLEQHRLAGIHERLGNTERARYWYGRFLNDWRNADPATPEVEDAKRRLATLGGPLAEGA